VLHGSGTIRFGSSSTTPAGPLITLTWIRSTTRTTSRSAFPKSPMAERDVQKGRTYSGCGPFVALSFPHAATLLLHSDFLSLYMHSVWRMLLPFLSFWLLALNLGRIWSALQFPFNPRCRDRNKNNCCFFCFLHDQNAFFSLCFPSHSHLTSFPRGILWFPTSTWDQKGQHKKGVSLREETIGDKKAQVCFCLLSSSLFLIYWQGWCVCERGRVYIDRFAS